ncbi:MAG TPA: hypothetical protein VI524_10155 [Anaerolineales bacterium]|nr:hypothetical protein [Anaerolineales bacterium]
MPIKPITFRYVCSAIVSILALFFAPPAQAYSSEPRLEISLERISPGGVLEVRLSLPRRK